MSRPLRIAVPNGWYHVVNRGIDGRQLFPDDRANEHFLELLQVSRAGLHSGFMPSC